MRFSTSLPPFGSDGVGLLAGELRFTHNNLAYCLNRKREHEQAERLCRLAIRVDPGRPNAWKNLGVSLYGQGDYPGAAQAWIQATRVNAADGRALRMLEKLLEHQPGLRSEIPYLERDLEECRRAVTFAREMMRAESGD